MGGTGIWVAEIHILFFMHHNHIFVLPDYHILLTDYHRGSRSKECDSLARQIWLWCIKNKIWISATHIPGSKNVEADQESRVFHDNTQWSLNPAVFQQLCGKIFMPEIDLFASRLNHKAQSYVAWRSDPKAVAIDAFTIS